MRKQASPREIHRPVDNKINSTDRPGRRIRSWRTRKRIVATSAIKAFTVRSLDLRHSMEGEFAQYAWETDYNVLPSHLDRSATLLLRTLVVHREVTTPTGSPRWEYRSRSQDGTLSTWLPEGQVLQRLLPLQLDVCHALWNLYPPGPARKPPHTKTRCRGLSSAEVLQLYSIDTRLNKMFGTEELEWQMFDYHAPYWEELSRSELSSCVREWQGYDGGERRV